MILIHNPSSPLPLLSFLSTTSPLLPPHLSFLPTHYLSSPSSPLPLLSTASPSFLPPLLSFLSSPLLSFFPTTSPLLPLLSSPFSLPPLLSFCPPPFYPQLRPRCLLFGRHHSTISLCFIKNWSGDRDRIGSLSEKGSVHSVHTTLSLQ